MRRPPSSALAFAAVLVVGCVGTAQDSVDQGRFVAHGAWTEFVPAWKAGPANFTWEGHVRSVREGTEYATNGTWLYVRNVVPEDAAEACRRRASFTEGTWVLTAASCDWSRHPSVACSGQDCPEATGWTRAPPP